MSEFVLDTSAVLSVLRGERGSEFVVQHGRGALISAVNTAEVFSCADVRNASRDFVEAAFGTMGLLEIPFDRVQAELLAEISPPGLGFVDRACLALAKSRGLIVLTGDRDLLQHDVGVEVRLFRESQTK